MATFLTTRHWESDESFTCFGKTYASKFIKSQENLNNDKSIPTSGKLPEDNPPSQPVKRKALNVSWRHAKSKTTKGIVLEPSHVKASALLYEITERTNQLAQPRIRTADDKLYQVRPSVSQIPKASPRIIELSKPRIPYQSPPKPIGYVAPGALTAVATQRIIELSKPKRRRRTKIANQRKLKLRKEKSRNYVKRGKRKSERKYSAFLRHKNDRKMKNKKKQSSLKTSNSNRTIIMVGLKLKNEKKTRRHS
ncbi:hypothetical protein WN48_06599 [Eufriesea mexicana]|uniref:Uncharacterized protein n=1 Tax=Eufriesea mexicana TaxID=516756 RepID=A0A310S8N8_9HYME|nr:hypothetical protein WN48_06599 [Eufriesea mexicana]